jgi:hypothetical protein
MIGVLGRVVAEATVLICSTDVRSRVVSKAGDDVLQFYLLGVHSSIGPAARREN